MPTPSEALDELCALGLPDDWSRVEMESGTAFARGDELRAADGDLDRATLVLWVGIHEVGRDVDFAERLRMDRRGGDIASIFVDVTPTRCVEFQLARSAHEKHARTIEDLATDLLANARWFHARPSSNGA